MTQAANKCDNITFQGHLLQQITQHLLYGQDVHLKPIAYNCFIIVTLSPVAAFYIASQLIL